MLERGIPMEGDNRGGRGARHERGGGFVIGQAKPVQRNHAQGKGDQDERKEAPARRAGEVVSHERFDSRVRAVRRL